MKKTLMLAMTAMTINGAFAIVQSESVNRKALSFTNQNVLKNISVDALSMKSNSALKAMQLKALSLGKSGAIRINQEFNGIEVYGSQVVFNIENNQVLDIDGRLAQIGELDTNASFSQAQALELAKSQLGSSEGLTAQLKILPLQEKNYLVWHISQAAFNAQWNLFIDAKSGKVVDAFNNLNMGTGAGHDRQIVDVESTFDSSKNNYVLRVKEGLKRETFDAKNKGGVFGPIIFGLPGDLCESKDDHWDDPAHVDAHNFAGSFLSVLKEKFNRNSFDDKGAKVVSTVHFMKKFVNAFWNGTQMVYGDGDNRNASNLAGGYDVVAHEISHAITTNTSNLAYRGESGALNEAFSDIMATYAESVTQPEKFDWLIGEDVWTPGVDGDALRYMNNPKKDGRSYDYYPERYTGSEDNGGVHMNSGIANLAFYLLSEGGKHPRKGGVDVKGIGIETAIQLFYNTFTKRLVSSSNFRDARNGMIKEAQSHSAEVQQAVADAWSAVGVN